MNYSKCHACREKFTSSAAMELHYGKGQKCLEPAHVPLLERALDGKRWKWSRYLVGGDVRWAWLAVARYVPQGQPWVLFRAGHRWAFLCETVRTANEAITADDMALGNPELDGWAWFRLDTIKYPAPYSVIRDA